METQFYYANEQKQSVGPFGLPELELMLEKGILASETQVCPQGSAAWVPISSLVSSQDMVKDESGRQSHPPLTPPPEPHSQAPEQVTPNKDLRQPLPPNEKESRPLIDTNLGRNVKSMGCFFPLLIAGVLAMVGLEIFSAVFDFDLDELQSKHRKALQIGATLVVYFFVRTVFSFWDGFKHG